MNLSIKKRLNINIRYKKKSGFTLIEVIAVIAIIGILSMLILPKVSGYIIEAKKTKVVDQCRKVVMAVESYNLKSETPLSESISVSNAKAKRGVDKYLDGVELTNIDPNNTTIKNCYDILKGLEFDFLEGTEKLNPSSIGADLPKSQTTP